MNIDFGFLVSQSISQHYLSEQINTRTIYSFIDSFILHFTHLISLKRTYTSQLSSVLELFTFEFIGYPLQTINNSIKQPKGSKNKKWFLPNCTKQHLTEEQKNSSIMTTGNVRQTMNTHIISYHNRQDKKKPNKTLLQDLLLLVSTSLMVHRVHQDQWLHSLLIYR